MSANRRVDYLLIGGGVASAQAAVGIRELDQSGSIEIVTDEPRLPYDRPPLSKGILLDKMTPEDAESKDASFYPNNNITVTQGTRVEALDLGARQATLANGESVEYGKALLATGASPRRPSLPGLDLEGVHLFRRVEDSLAVREALKNAKSAVMVGAGFIGMEIAAACIAHKVPVTIIDPAERPMARFTGPRSGGYLRAFFERHGAKFYLGSEVESLVGENRVEGVRLKSGETIPADLVVVGVGVELNLGLARDAGLPVNDREGVEADEYLRTPNEAVYVAGDIAFFQDRTIGKKWHAEHYLNAKWQGKQVGRNMAGANEPYERVPYFFSDLLDLHFVLRGDPRELRPVKIEGEVDLGEFVELFAHEDGTIAMGIAFSHSEPRLDAISDKLEEMILAKRPAVEISETDFELDSDKGLG